MSQSLCCMATPNYVYKSKPVPWQDHCFKLYQIVEHKVPYNYVITNALFNSTSVDGTLSIHVCKLAYIYIVVVETILLVHWLCSLNIIGALVVVPYYYWYTCSGLSILVHWLWSLNIIGALVMVS